MNKRDIEYEQRNISEFLRKDSTFSYEIDGFVYLFGIEKILESMWKLYLHQEERLKELEEKL